MSDKHTPEPWKVFYTTDGTAVMGIGYAPTAEGITDPRFGLWGDKEEAEANARRIVAAVNACSGIPTAELEAGVVDEAANVLIEALDFVEVSAKGAVVEERILAVLARLGRAP